MEVLLKNLGGPSKHVLQAAAPEQQHSQQEFTFPGRQSIETQRAVQEEEEDKTTQGGSALGGGYRRARPTGVIIWSDYLILIDRF